MAPRQVMTLLVKECVGRVIFVHNHPSGDPTPSPEDVRFTQQLIDAAKTLDIRVLDHVVVAATGFASIRETLGGVRVRPHAFPREQARLLRRGLDLGVLPYRHCLWTRTTTSRKVTRQSTNAASCSNGASLRSSH